MDLGLTLARWKSYVIPQFGLGQPHLPKSIPLDPWGNDYQYRVPGDDGRPFTLASLGQDGQLGGSDDAADIVYVE